MKTAKLFKNGSSQAIRLPKDFRFEGTEVHIEKIGNSMVVTPKQTDWSDLVALCGTSPEPIFPNGRKQGKIKQRESIIL